MPGRNAAPAMRVAIASRIFDPEPSAASFRLGALATMLAEQGHEVSVLTVQPPASLADRSQDSERPYKVRRRPVLRDSSGYVRGYLPYLSFDIPLFFRVLFGPKVDAIVAEPPPTTGLAVRIAAALRRTPYIYYAADIWSDGAAQTGAASWVVQAVKGVELFALRGAATVLSVSDSLTSRLSTLGVRRNVLTVGNGVESTPFFLGIEGAESYRRSSPAEFVYAGTASEWHGATVFVEALPALLAKVPGARIRFIGSGSDFAAVEARAEELGVAHAVSAEPAMPPSDLAPVLRRATAALASIRPGLGNEFTFPTKLYASTLSGTPAIFAGVGPAVEFLQTELSGTPLGLAVDLDPAKVAEAMVMIANQDKDTEQRMRVAAWGLEHVSLTSVAEQIVAELERIAKR